ncbi:MAG: hypothetical protein ABL897_06415 [Hyphomicrobium sp.]
MFNRSWSLISAAGTIALLPLALPDVPAPHRQLAVNFSAQPVSIVVTATRPLDLAVLTAADFGDGETVR